MNIIDLFKPFKKEIFAGIKTYKYNRYIVFVFEATKTIDLKLFYEEKELAEFFKDKPKPQFEVICKANVDYNTQDIRLLHIEPVASDAESKVKYLTRFMPKLIVGIAEPFDYEFNYKVLNMYSQGLELGRLELEDIK